MKKVSVITLTILAISIVAERVITKPSTIDKIREAGL